MNILESLVRFLNIPGVKEELKRVELDNTALKKGMLYVLEFPKMKIGQYGHM